MKRAILTAVLVASFVSRVSFACESCPAEEEETKKDELVAHNNEGCGCGKKKPVEGSN